MNSEKETYLTVLAEQLNLEVDITPLLGDGDMTFDSEWKRPELLLYYKGWFAPGIECGHVAVFYKQLEEKVMKEGDNPFLPEFMSPDPIQAKIVDARDLEVGIPLEQFIGIVNKRIDESVPGGLMVNNRVSTKVHLKPCLYFISRPCQKEGFKLVDVSDLLTEILPETRLAATDSVFVSQQDDERDFFNAILNAKDARGRYVEDQANILNEVLELIPEEERQKDYYVQEDCLVLEPGRKLPFYFNASQGGAFVSCESLIWKIRKDVVLPQYLMMQLYSDYAINQYYANDIRLSSSVLAGTYIYMPEGDKDFSLYEQHRLLTKRRTELIESFALKHGIELGDNYQLPASCFLQKGKYQILAHIDNGGFGKIYHAIAKGRGARLDVALKELFVREYCRRKDFSETVTVSPANKRDFDRQKSKFADEYNILLKVGEHTKYVPRMMSEPFKENNTVYYAMQYIDNGTLWHHCKEQDIDAHDKLRLICHAGIALHHAHNLDYLHLDVSPQNIMVDKEGNGILIDFGNSKHYSVEEKKITSVGNAALTRPFAPPELMQQQVGQYYMQTDVYSLAMTLFAALTTMVPGNRHEAYISGMLTDCDVPDNVKRAIVKVTQYEVEDRYSTIRDFLLALLPSIDDESLRNEITVLQPVTGFSINNHKVNPDDTITADYMPLSE